MPYFTQNNLARLYYIEIYPQSKQTIVLLHGLGATSSSWTLQIPCLEEAGYHILAPDTRGFGQSDYPGPPGSIDDMADDIANLLANLNISSAHIAGISMGGMLALSLALRYPAMVDKLVLINTFAALRPKMASTWFYYALRLVLVHTLGLRVQAQAVAKRIFPLSEQEALRQAFIEQVLQANPKGYRAAMRALARFNVTKKLSIIPNHTLIVTGQNDTTVPLQCQVQLKAIPLSRHVIIPRAGHAVTIDQPGLFDQALLSFLQENDDQQSDRF